MARPREFDEEVALRAAVECFWERGYEATSVRDLATRMGITNASLYNAFGDKRSLYRRALERYVELSFSDRVGRFQALPPREAIDAFFKEIVDRSVADTGRRGCMLVNSALEIAPYDPEFQDVVTKVLVQVEAFFRQCAMVGQEEGTIARRQSAEDIGRLLLGVLLGLRVLARHRPERALLEGLVRPALALLDDATVGARDPLA
ncbi:TetR/AcrR family transcriptional regulator [Roseixanthobacter pseudopolyaromaticivorans]|uniref:TetR/AcrR family transcriptional regulator n=1 Tax=Xanthobacteraceae TaxID=335928 RepID=UPI00372B6B83